MDDSYFSYPLWMRRMTGEGSDKTRIAEIVARYSHLLYSADPVLNHISLDELQYIGALILELPQPEEVRLAPYCFADLYLATNPELQYSFNSCPFPLQCKIIDTALVYANAEEFSAMIAMDWERGTTQLLALSTKKDDLRELSLAFLSDPLIATLIDTQFEKEKAYLLDRAKELLIEEKTEKEVGVYTVRCSEELFANNVFALFLDCPFVLQMGEEKDRWGRNTPSYIREADEDRPY